MDHGGTASHGATVAIERALPLWPAKLLLFTLTMPFFFQIGPLLLTADRFFLLAAFVPFFVFWLSGRAGPIHFADIAILSLWSWQTISTIVTDGAAVAIEASGVNMLETLGAYFVARCLIRDADAFFEIVRFLFRIILVLLPFAIFETLTGQNLLLDTANKIWPSYGDVPKEERLGLDRVALVFHHPILFGVFCGSCFALSYYVLGYGSSRLMRALRTATVGFTAFLALSSGPLAALLAQSVLMAWDQVLKSVRYRWKLLSGGVIFFWVSLEIAASRSVPELFISAFAFNKSTAYNRIRIWRYGTQSVAEHPWFGIGRSIEWQRPWWMSDSMDMFWLVPAVRYGLPAGLLLHATFLGVFLAVAFKRDLDERTSAYRTGFLICLMGFYLAGWTVHYWKVIYVLFIFLLGSGVWILTAQERPGSTPLPKRKPILSGRVAPAYRRQTIELDVPAEVRHPLARNHGSQKSTGTSSVEGPKRFSRSFELSERNSLSRNLE
ncbi:MAG: hypothetical protein AAF583_10615 [Pseudomonadota bacterium]